MKLLAALVSTLFFALGSAHIAFAADPLALTPKPNVEQQQSLININTADVAALTQLKGVGAKKAEAIIAWRNAHGKFKTLEQLMDVKGIGEAILAANRDKISI
jgi:competence protein ComEA